MIQDEELYLQATQEVDDEVIDAALWAKSMTLAEGDTKIVKYKYIKLRVEQIKQSAGAEEEKNIQKKTLVSEKIPHEKRTEGESIQQERMAEVGRMQQARRLESEKIQQEHAEVITGLSEIGCTIKHRLFGGWMIKEPLGGVVNVKTIKEANEYYQTKKPASTTN